MKSFKKLFGTLVMFVLAVVCVFVLSTEAQAADITASGTCGANLTWELDSEGTLTISGTGKMGNYDSSGSPWMANCSSITKVIIEDGVTSIGNYAFRLHTNLSSVDIPDGVTSIGESAFFNCVSLTSVDIPVSVGVIYSSAFAQCTSLTDVYYGGNAMQWEAISKWNSYMDMSRVTLHTVGPEWTGIRIGNLPTKTQYKQYESLNTAGMTLIASFSDGSTQTISSGFTVSGYSSSVIGVQTLTVTYGSKTTTFNVEVVRSGTCGTNLTWTLDSAGILTISGTGAMKNYTSSSYAPWYNYRTRIKTIIINDSVETIGDYAFRGCTSISTTIGDSVTSIGTYAFLDCASMTSITIPDSVTTINFGAFYCCSNLTAITIPDSVTTIGRSVFDYCTNLTGIWATEGNAYYSSDTNGVLFNKDMTVLVQVPGAISGSYMIPTGVESISDSAFGSNASLTSVSIPGTVTTIGYGAFDDCGLTSVTIPNSVTNIGGSAFYGCSSLTTVTIGDGVETIGNLAFQNCSSLTSVTIGRNVTTIGNQAFYQCSNLSKVYYTGTRADWEKITIGTYNSALQNATIYHDCKTAAIIGSGEYITLPAALANAVSGDEVTLVEDVVLSEDVVLPVGVTLNLNGHSLTADSLTAFSTSHVTDSSADSSGVLTLPGELVLPADNPQLPLYDTAKGGYRFFTGSSAALGTVKGDNDNVQFWFRLEFDDPEVYSLLASGTSRLKIDGTLTVGATEVPLSFSEDVIQKYAAMEVEAHDPNSANYGRTAGIRLNLTSVSAAKDSRITMLPTANSAGVELAVSDTEKLMLKGKLSWEYGADFWTVETKELVA